MLNFERDYALALAFPFIVQDVYRLQIAMGCNKSTRFLQEICVFAGNWCTMRENNVLKERVILYFGRVEDIFWLYTAHIPSQGRYILWMLDVSCQRIKVVCSPYRNVNLRDRLLNESG